MFQQLSYWEGIWLLWVFCRGAKAIQSNPKILGNRQGKFSPSCSCTAARLQHRTHQPEFFSGCDFAFGQPVAPRAILSGVSDCVCVCCSKTGKIDQVKHFSLGKEKQKRESLAILPWVFGTWHQPSFPPLSLQMSHWTGCRHCVSLPTWLSPHPASYSQTNPLLLEGQNPGQLFTQPPYGVCFSIDPQMMCYYSGGAENYMTKPGLFLR